MEGSEYYKLMLLRQFKASQRKLWPVLETTPEKAMSDVRRYLEQTQRSFDLIMLDMPGTVSAPGVFRVLAELDYIFVPMKADKLVMESAVSFAKAVNEQLVQNPDYNLRGLRMFWTMIDRRERTPLYEQYEKALDIFHLPRLKTQIPYRSRFNKEILDAKGSIGRSTLFPAEKTFAQEAQIGALAQEILSIIEV